MEVIVAPEPDPPPPASWAFVVWVGPLRCYLSSLVCRLGLLGDSGSITAGGT